MKIEIYTDGSYMKEADPKHVYGGFVVLADGEPVVVTRIKSDDANMVSAWNAGGELLAACYGVTTAYLLMTVYEAQGMKVEGEVILYHDYNGVANFMTAPKGQNKPWSAKKPASRRYVGMMNALAKQYSYTIRYQWVKGHSGNEWNEVVDKIAGGRYQKYGKLPDLMEVEDH